MLHFVTSYMKQNKSRKQTLESAQYGLEISFKTPIQLNGPAGVRFSKDPKTSRARKPPRKAPETTFGCFSKHPKNTLVLPVNFTGTHYLPKSVFGSVFLVLA